MRDRPQIRKRLQKLKKASKNHRPLSVLMLSIDSVSRLNLIRSMPQTYRNLVDNQWFELQGYNKVRFQFKGKMISFFIKCFYSLSN